MRITREMIAAFDRAWHIADARGQRGHRVEAGLEAVMVLVMASEGGGRSQGLKGQWMGDGSPTAFEQGWNAALASLGVDDRGGVSDETF